MDANGWRKFHFIIRAVLSSKIKALGTNQRKKYARQRRKLNGIGKAALIRRRERRKELVLAFRNAPCTDCGKFYGVRHMEFDHVPERGQKLFAPSEGLGSGLAKLLRELAKCDVVCCSCHEKREHTRGRTHGDFGIRQCPNVYGPGGCKVDIMKGDDFGDRMKEYEQAEAGRKAMPLLPLCVRLDGKGFSRWTRNLDRPFDQRLSNLMVEVTKFLVEETHASIGYTQSDEISLVYQATDYNSEIYFDGKFQKLCSVLASMATAYFNKWAPAVLQTGHTDRAGLAYFDCRAWNVPNEVEAANAFLWREKDATKNSISMATRHYYSHNEMHEKSSSEMQEMLFQKDVNWNNYPDFFKRGTFVQRRTYFKELEPEILLKIPEDKRPVGGKVERTQVVKIPMPPFSKVTNRVEVIFRKADPVKVGCARCDSEKWSFNQSSNGINTCEKCFLAGVKSGEFPNPPELSYPNALDANHPGPNDGSCPTCHWDRKTDPTDYGNLCGECFSALKSH